MTYDFTLDGPVERYVAPNETERLLRLTQRPGNDKGGTLVFYIDRSFHVVRMDEDCALPTDDCRKFQSMLFWSEGRLPPLGILWPHAHAAEGALLIHRTNEDAVVPVDLDARTNWTMHVADPGRDVAEGAYTTILPGTYEYDEYAFVPISGPGIRLEALEVGERLEVADAHMWRNETIAVADGPFGGYDEDEFGLGMSLRDVWESLMETNETARTLWSRWGCFLGMNFDAPRSDETSALALKTHVTTIEIMLGEGESHRHVFEMEVSHDAIGRTTANMASASAAGFVTHCAERATSPGPGASLADAERLRREAAPSGILSGVTIRPSSAVLHRPVSAGWYEYWFTMVPEWAQNETSTWLYILIVDATTGQTLRLTTHADDFPDL